MRLLVLFLAIIFVGLSDSACRTNNLGAKKDLPCIIPFKFHGKLRNSCVLDPQDDGQYWCPTQVNSQLEPLQGKWGYCPGKCQIEEDADAEYPTCVNQKGKVCEKSWIFKGKLNHGCVWDESDKKYWCSNKVDNQLRYIFLQ